MLTALRCLHRLMFTGLVLFTSLVAFGWFVGQSQANWTFPRICEGLAYWVIGFAVGCFVFAFLSRLSRFTFYTPFPFLLAVCFALLTGLVVNAELDSSVAVAVWWIPFLTSVTWATFLSSGDRINFSIVVKNKKIVRKFATLFPQLLAWSSTVELAIGVTVLAFYYPEKGPFEGPSGIVRDILVCAAYWLPICFSMVVTFLLLRRDLFARVGSKAVEARPTTSQSISADVEGQ